jgi:hypothetical protein
VQLYFRDDDFGWEMERFTRLACVFADQGHKLNAAAIPQLTTAAAIESGVPGYASASVQFVVHGFSHSNHEPAGKKSEFGPSRNAKDVERELAEGIERVGSAAGNFFPCFVPPWNSIDARFLPSLADAGYRMLSRFEKSGNVRGPVPERSVSLDLHTRKDGSRLSPEAILAAINEARKHESTLGVMLHHNRMEESDFATLTMVLAALRAQGTQSFFYSELAIQEAPNA